MGCPAAVLRLRAARILVPSPARLSASRRHGLARRPRLAIAHGQGPPLWPPWPLGRAVLAGLPGPGLLLRSRPGPPLLCFTGAFLSLPAAWPHGTATCLIGMRPPLLGACPAHPQRWLLCCRSRERLPRRATVRRRGVGNIGVLADHYRLNWHTSALLGGLSCPPAKVAPLPPIA